MMKIQWKYLIPLFVFLFLAGFMFKGLYLDPRKVPSALIDKPAPEFRLPTLQDPAKTVTKKDLLGKVYLLNVWASWCQACQYEHPYFIELKNKGEKVMMVGYNYRDKPAMARRWLQQLGDPYDVTIVDENGQAAIDFGVYGAPETFVIDKKGVIRYKVIGPLTDAIWKKDVGPLVRQLEAQ